MKRPTISMNAPEIYETHIMSDLSVIFHTDRITMRNDVFFNWHENIEIIYFREGEADVHHNSDVFRAHVGDIVIFPANSMHAITAEKVLYDCLILDRGFCLSTGIDTSAFTFPSLVRDEKLISLYRRVADEVEEGEKRYRICAVKGAVLSLLAYLCRNYAVENTDKDPRSVEGIKKTLIYIREHIAEDLCIEDLASVAGFSKFHFAREFKRVTSYTVVSYLNLVRIEKAKSMLSMGAASVGEVALSCGFNNFSYFSKIFRMQTGITPSEYMSFTRKE